MGDVYRAVDERLDRQVAVKHLQPPFARERFRREAKAIAKLSHPAIVQVFDVFEDETGGWIVMELVEGRQLSSLIASGPLDLAAALPIFEDLAEALGEAHDKGVLHRDLKTENVMVTPAGRAKLLDFGLARWIEPQDHNVTLDGQIIGTPHAMSPEQAMSLDLDGRSDLFSLGTLFYEALTGVRPFHGDGFVETIRKVCVERQPPAHQLSPGIPRALSRLVDRMLDKEPGRRPADAGAVARVLRRIDRPAPAEGGPGSTQAVPPARGSGGPGERRAASGERRTITILHCELVISGSLSGLLDPEDLLELRPDLQRIAARAAARFEGEIDQRLGQGLRLFFGFPHAHDDDARRAVYAAREIVIGVEGQFAGTSRDLGIRVGIHTGPVVVAADPGSAGRGPALALGETGNLAAVLQELASPGEILLSAATRAIVEPFFDTEARPPAPVPGLAEPVEAFRWLGEASPRKRPG